MSDIRKSADVKCGRVRTEELPDLQLGAVSFYNVTVEVCGQPTKFDEVSFYIGNDNLGDGLIENRGKRVTMTRSAWDAMNAAVNAKSEAA